MTSNDKAAGILADHTAADLSGHTNDTTGYSDEDVTALGAMFVSGADTDWDADPFPDLHDPECFACAKCAL